MYGMRDYIEFISDRSGDGSGSGYLDIFKQEFIYLCVYCDTLDGRNDVAWITSSVA